MNIKRILPALAFIAIALYILMGFQDMLHTAHLRTPFIGHEQFWAELQNTPFASMRWLGCWLTQMCYYPVLGIFVYLLLWTIGYYFADRTLRLPDKWASLTMLPFAAMLAGIVAVGYWIYIMRDFGFWYSQSLAFVIMLGLLWLAKKISTNTVMTVIVAVAISLLFPVLGWYTLLMALCLMILKFREQRWNVFIYAIAFLSPGIWRGICYDAIASLNVWLGGFPVFIDAYKYCLRVSAPFIVVAVSLVILCVVAEILRNQPQVQVSSDNKKGAKKGSWNYLLVCVIVSLVSLFGVKAYSFDDYNYQAEMRLTNYALVSDWKSLLKEYQKAEAPSRAMVELKNIALLNLGQLGERSFKLGNDGKEIYNPDGIQVNSMHVCAPTVYYHYGWLNYAIRWCMEFAVGYGFSPYYLMSSANVAIATGEEGLAYRYTEMLHSGLFYSDWLPRKASPIIESLSGTYANMLDADNNNMEIYLIELFSGSYVSENGIIRDLCLTNAMLRRQPDLFWKAFVNYCAGYPDEPLPVHYQEAYCAFMNLMPVELQFKVNINKQIPAAFNSFLSQYDRLKKSGLEEEEIGAEMKAKWGKTYWWHFLFGRKAY